MARRSRVACTRGWRSQLATYGTIARRATGRKAVCIFHAGAGCAVIENIYMLFMGHTCFKNRTRQFLRLVSPCFPCLAIRRTALVFPCLERRESLPGRQNEIALFSTWCHLLDARFHLHACFSCSFRGIHHED